MTTALSTPGSTLVIDAALEDKVMACMFRLGDFMSVAAAHLKPSYFGNPLRRNLAKMAIDFWNNYNAIIKGNTLALEIASLIDKKIIRKDEGLDYGNYVLGLNKIDISDFKWVLDKLVIFIKHKELTSVINESVAKYLPRNEYDKIEKALMSALSVTAIPSPAPYAYMSESNIESRSVRRERAATVRSTGILTGIPAMDGALAKGGWYRRELYVIMAPPKRGKTMSLLWFACFAAQQGFNVLFFTLETSVEVLTDRLDAMNTQIATKMLNGKANHIKAILKSKKWTGDIFFLEYPTKCCTVSEMERQVSKFERESGNGVDMVIVDYGDLVKPPVRRESKLDEQAETFEALRGMAGKFNIPVLTATQVNRSGTGKAVNDGTDIAGSFEKVMVADEIISLSATDTELKEGNLRISFAESRNSERKSFLVKTNYAVGTFYKEFIKAE